MAKTAHGTLTAATVATVTVTGDVRSIEIVNRGTDAIYYRLDGTNPVVDAADTFIVPASAVDTVSFDGASAESRTVKLISSGTPAYSVQGRAT